MANLINYVLQDATALLTAIDNNREAMASKGFSETKYAQFVSDLNELKQKEAAQQKAVDLKESRTDQQKQVIADVGKYIRLVQNAAKSAFGNDATALKKFKVGESVPLSVKKLRSISEYLTSVVLEYHDVLLENGLSEEDINNLNSSYGLLISADASQENSKKLQVSATMARDAAAQKLKDQVFRIRNFAKACFVGSPEILVEFKPIPKGRGAEHAAETKQETKTEPTLEEQKQ